VLFDLVERDYHRIIKLEPSLTNEAFEGYFKFMKEYHNLRQIIPKVLKYRFVFGDFKKRNESRGLV